mgnify:FL=1
MTHFNIGQAVKVKEPEQYNSSFAKKIKDRVGVVRAVYMRPTDPVARQYYCGPHNKAKVQFLKRNGRGKEFEELFNLNELEIVQVKQTTPLTDSQAN